MEEVSASRTFYVYALKDPTSSPSLPFYIGKGTGSRSREHELRPDDSEKGLRIKSIQEAGYQVLTVTLVDNLTEHEALRVEAQLIGAFGTTATGGILTNCVIPTGTAEGRRRVISIPSGVREKAQIGLELLKDSVLELTRANPKGLSNADVAHTLGLQSEFMGGSKDYLSFSILGLLIRAGSIVRSDRRYQAQVR